MSRLADALSAAATAHHIAALSASRTTLDVAFPIASDAREIARFLDELDQADVALARPVALRWHHDGDVSVRLAIDLELEGAEVLEVSIDPTTTGGQTVAREVSRLQGRHCRVHLIPYDDDVVHLVWLTALTPRHRFDSDQAASPAASSDGAGRSADVPPSSNDRPAPHPPHELNPVGSPDQVYARLQALGVGLGELRQAVAEHCETAGLPHPNKIPQDLRATGPRTLRAHPDVLQFVADWLAAREQAVA